MTSDWPMVDQNATESERRAAVRDFLAQQYELTATGRELLREEATRARRVREAEARIIAEEGMFHVSRCYYGTLGAADRARRIEAERRVREADRREAYESRQTAEDVSPRPAA